MIFKGGRGKVGAVARSSVKKKFFDTIYREKIFLALATGSTIVQALDLPQTIVWGTPAVGESFWGLPFFQKGQGLVF